jgi:pyruvate kinase
MCDTDDQIASVEQMLLTRGFKTGDIVVITMGVPLGSRGSTNLLKVLKLTTSDSSEAL